MVSANGIGGKVFLKGRVELQCFARERRCRIPCADFAIYPLQTGNVRGLPRTDRERSPARCAAAKLETKDYPDAHFAIHPLRTGTVCGPEQ